MPAWFAETGSAIAAPGFQTWVLDVEIDAGARAARLRLLDAGGAPVAEHRAALDVHAARWEGVFDTRRFVRRTARDPRQVEVLLDAIGGFVGREVLGPEITRALAAGEQRRGLLVRLCGAASDPLVRAFVRVPWELARVEGDLRTLEQRNVLVRVTTSAVSEPRRAPEGGDAIRVLLVFAEPPGARPVGARQEREELLDAFFRDILPQRDVEVDVLCHGVTRARIWEQVRRRGGYHVVHWSGRGRGDALEVALEDGEAEEPLVSGDELADLFSGAGAGEQVPRLFFLSAVRSGGVGSVRDWAELEAALRPGETVRAEPDDHAAASAALALLDAGVQEVVTMRHAVSAAYARGLAQRFYRRLLGGELCDAALAGARRELSGDPGASRGAAEAVSGTPPEDHAAAFVLGAWGTRFAPAARPSAQAERRAPRPQPLLPSGSKDLDPQQGFVGRGLALARLAGAWLPAHGAPVALIEGPPGMGKTSLAAEAIHLWHGDFDRVIAVQAYGWSLSPGAALRRVLRLLTAEPQAAGNAAPADVAGALRAERVLLVLDGLAAAAGEADAWGPPLEALGARLRGGGSRVLVTSRRTLAPAAAPEDVLRVPLGPLLLGEALLLAERCPALRDLLRGDAEAVPLARRVIEVSAGQPLVLLRLGDLAAMRGGAGPSSGVPTTPRAESYRRPTGRASLQRALDRIEPASSATGPQDAAVAVVDLLLETLSSGARRLLWNVTLAGEPVRALMFEDLARALQVPEGKLRSLLDELCAAGLVSRQVDEARGTVYGFHELVAERIAAWMERNPDERGDETAEDVWQRHGERYSAAFRNALPMLQQGTLAATPALESRPPPASNVGREPAFVAPSNVGRDSGIPGPLSPRLPPSSFVHSVPPPISVSPLSDARPSSRLRRPRELAADLGRRSIRYLVRARAFHALSSFASAAVSMVADAALLAEVVADLQAAADEAHGDARWRTRIALADALRDARRVGEALPLYERAAAEAEAAAAWGDLGVIRNKWAGALALAGRLEAARAMYERSADAKRRAGKPRVSIVGCELMALRMEVACGAAPEALPRILARLHCLRAWWGRRQQREEVPEAPDDAQLAATLAEGLDVARRAHAALDGWGACLALLDEIDRLDRAQGASDHERTKTRFHRVTPLVRLERMVEAREVIEACLEGFRRVRDTRGEASALSALADVAAETGDAIEAIALEREALAVRERFAGAGERALSHGRLASLLHRGGQPAEAVEHGLAAAAYQIAAGMTPRAELRELLARAAALSPLPRLSDVLDRPALAALRRTLGERGLSSEGVQASIDELLSGAPRSADRPGAEP